MGITGLFCKNSWIWAFVFGLEAFEDYLRRNSNLKAPRSNELNYKNRLHPRVSNAEIELFKALSAEGLTGGMVTQKPIILKSTVPDFMWHEKRKVVYLDGVQVHTKDKQCDRDAEIDELLELQGWEVLRIPYDPPLSQTDLQKIVSVVREFLGLKADE
jgi:very-short-patch-repair endonuclease